MWNSFVKSNRFKKYFELLVLVAVLTVVAVAGFYYIKTDLLVVAPVVEMITQTLQVSSPDLSAGLPIRLKIPSIKVDAAIEYVGIAPDGNMDVPKGPDNVAWFEPGTRPGDVGSAVLAGH